MGAHDDGGAGLRWRRGQQRASQLQPRALASLLLALGVRGLRRHQPGEPGQRRQRRRRVAVTLQRSLLERQLNLRTKTPLRK